MSKFTPKRVTGAELAEQFAEVTANTPAAVRVPSAPPPKPRHPAVVQVNFKASEAFADLIAREAEKAGSTRRLFARLMRDAGYDVPDADVMPADNRRHRRVGG